MNRNRFGSRGPAFAIVAAASLIVPLAAFAAGTNSSLPVPRAGWSAWQSSRHAMEEPSRSSSAPAPVSVRRSLAGTSCPLPGPSQKVNCVNQPFDLVEVNTCNNNEIVEGTGTWHVDAITTFDPISMTVTITQHSNWQNVRGVGSDGNTYQA